MSDFLDEYVKTGKIPQLKTFCMECPNCGGKICVDRYTKIQAQEDLDKAIGKHSCKKGVSGREVKTE